MNKKRCLNMKNTQACAIRYCRGRQSWIVGKLLNVGGQLIFHFSVRDKDVLRRLDALSVAPEVLDFLESQGVEEIHAFHRDEGILYVTRPGTLRAHGVLASMNPAIGKRYHLPRRFWRRTRLHYHVPYIQAERIVQAHEDESLGVQLALAL